MNSPAVSKEGKSPFIVKSYRLTIQAKLDEHSYPIGQKISDEELSKVNLQRDLFQGNWNYSILPNLIS